MRDVVDFHRLKSSGRACCNGTSRETQFIGPGKLDLMIYYVAAGGWNQGSGQGMIRRKSAVSTLSFGETTSAGARVEKTFCGAAYLLTARATGSRPAVENQRGAQKSAEQLQIDTGAGWRLLSSSTSPVHNLLGEETKNTINAYARSCSWDTTLRNGFQCRAWACKIRDRDSLR
ncbi:hypothetical protein CKAH01_09558 [Colletotrichum kahawae]|uniref:Uncharacterized protein n=1 Tax=Colletotrichum kahawae TaxID=34407 RepID=A0AAD9XXW6_COLKA|nr:hypothetical protein CKAH01_09558 [Colletotrichum kahawae]